MRPTRLRVVMSAALALGVIAIAPLPVAAATRHCQMVYYNFGYSLNTMDAGGNVYTKWTTTAQLQASGCWTATQTWNTRFVVTRPSGTAFTVRTKAASPSGPYSDTNFWANLQITSYGCWDNGSGIMTCANGSWGLYPRVHLRPSSSTTVGNWSTESSCGLDSGYETGRCRVGSVVRTYLGPVTLSTY